MFLQSEDKLKTDNPTYCFFFVFNGLNGRIQYDKTLRLFLNKPIENYVKILPEQANKHFCTVLYKNINLNSDNMSIFYAF